MPTKAVGVVGGVQEDLAVRDVQGVERHAQRVSGAARRRRDGATTLASSLGAGPTRRQECVSSERRVGRRSRPSTISAARAPMQNPTIARVGSGPRVPRRRPLALHRLGVLQGVAALVRQRASPHHLHKKALSASPGIVRGSRTRRVRGSSEMKVCCR